MTDKHDFKAALLQAPIGVDTQSDIDFMATYRKEVHTALRIADRLQSGHVSKEMSNAGYQTFSMSYKSGEKTSNCFKAMAAQLMKEEG